MTTLDLKNVKSKVDKRKSLLLELKEDLEERRPIWNKLPIESQMKWLNKDPVLLEAKEIYMVLNKFFSKISEQKEFQQ